MKLGELTLREIMVICESHHYCSTCQLLQACMVTKSDFSFLLNLDLDVDLDELKNGVSRETLTETR